MKIYLDANYKCNISNNNTIEIIQTVETDFFDGKCEEFVNGYRFIPDGHSWTRSDGMVFDGEMISPWKPYSELATAQAEYEHEQLAIVTADRDEIETAMAQLVEEVYQADLEVIG